MDTANIGDVRTGVRIFLVPICFFFCSSTRLLCNFRTSFSVTELRMVLTSFIVIINDNNTNCDGVMVYLISETTGLLTIDRTDDISLPDSLCCPAARVDTTDLPIIIR